MDLLVAVQNALVFKGVSFERADRVERRVPAVALEWRVVGDKLRVTARPVEGQDRIIDVQATLVHVCHSVSPAHRFVNLNAVALYFASYRFYLCARACVF